ncbi:MAG: N-acetylmuramoyl-L-alanine amidase [Anaerolineae bacterium]
MNKVCLQVIGDRFDPARLVGPHGEKPRLVKLVDCSLAFYWKVRGVVGPTVLIIIRWTQTDQPLDNPVQRAQDWYNAHRSYILALAGEYIMFEGLNEIDDSQAEPYSQYEVERARLLHLDNQGALLGNRSVGRPDLPLWSGPYAKVIAACTARDAIGLHEYWSDTADIDNRWHCGRWTLVPQLAKVNIVIGEGGRDYLPDTKQGQPGYKLTCSDDVMVSDIGKYGALADQYPRVLGVTLYQVGSIDPRWQPFDLSSLWGRITAQYVQEQEVTPVPIVITHPPMTIDGRQLKASDFITYAEGLGLKGKYDRVFIHHTASPDEITWDNWGGWDYWKKQLVAFYATKIWYDAQGVKHVGWDTGPHLFVDQVGMGLFWDLSKDGTGVYANNTRTRHIEVVGNFNTRLPDGERLANAITAAAELLKAAGLTIDALSYHKASQPDTDCPGAMLISKWSWFKGLVSARLAALQPPPPIDINQVIGDAAQAHIIPLNLNAALAKALTGIGALPASGEFDVQANGVTYRCQAGRKSSEIGRQYIAYCKIGEWDKVTIFDRAN